MSTTRSRKRKVLLLHGNRQTGHLLLSRVDKLRKRLQQKLGLELVTVDAPFPHDEDSTMRQWWRRGGDDDDDGDNNRYIGLEQTFHLLQSLWTEEEFCGIIGFSQGARLAHLMAVAHMHTQHHPSTIANAATAATNTNTTTTPMFPGLRFVILVAGYDAPLPDNYEFDNNKNNNSSNTTRGNTVVSVPSLHVWGLTDSLITPAQSEAVSRCYFRPQIHVHEGGHHVPMRAASVKAYMDFIEECCIVENVDVTGQQPQPQSAARQSTSVAKVSATPRAAAASAPPPPQQQQQILLPDEEALQAQHEELEALSAIYPDEFKLLSKKKNENGVDHGDSPSCYEHPIRYRVDLPRSDEGIWPPHPMALEVTYPHNYPSMDVSPTIRMLHQNNVMEFSTAQADACSRTIAAAAEAEQGMPCVLSCIQAARDFFESGAMATIDSSTTNAITQTSVLNAGEDDVEDEDVVQTSSNSKIQAASAARILECNLQGLKIAESLLKQQSPEISTGKGGSWTYTIGLVGKPSAGKSTFFNVATAFARQRDDTVNALGGATMAPHPFTTIDPNVGFCLVPAPPGSCPEEGYDGPLKIGCTHGRDHNGRRLLPVLLKDVAGLVPGAYQGRGRGNKFLNDLTDADVLIHVLDGSGTADSEGNTVGVENDGKPSEGASHPINDLAWIRNELCEWVYQNILYKWDTIRAKGQHRLAKMFSGYGQTQAVTMDVLAAVEKYLEAFENRDRALSTLYEWDEGDLHRLVSTFLGVRFPMALAINKFDMSTSKEHVKDILAALPIHGAHVGVPMCARSEMLFMRKHICNALGKSSPPASDEDEKFPTGVWQCLQEAITLKEPVFVFPVIDFTSYAPLPGMNRNSTEDASLPNAGMVACLEASGGSAPSLWNPNQRVYVAPRKNVDIALRDVLIMKPGSTVEDCYQSLKRLGALSGEFVRAEACGDVGAAPKPVPKHQVITKSFRILKVMTKKKASWQNNSGR